METIKFKTNINCTNCLAKVTPFYDKKRVYSPGMWILIIPIRYWQWKRKHLRRKILWRPSNVPVEVRTDVINADYQKRYTFAADITTKEMRTIMVNTYWWRFLQLTKS